MKNKIIIIALILFTYTGLWYFQSYNIEKLIKNEYPHLTYDNIEKTGFPFAIQLSFLNPKFKNDNFAAEFEGTLHSNWTILGKPKELTFDGKTLVSAPYTFQIDGNTTVQLDSLSEGIAFFKKITISSNSFALPLGYSIDAAELHYNMANFEEKGTKLSLNADVKEFAPLLFKENKQNIACVVDWEMPPMAIIERFIHEPELLLSEKIPDIILNVKKLETKSPLCTSELSGLLKVTETKEKEVTANFTGKTSLKCMPGYDQAYLETVDKLITLSDEQLQNDETRQAISILSKDKGNFFKDILPKFDELGTVAAKADVNLKYNKNNANWHLLINELEFSCDKYGSKLKTNIQNHSNFVQVDSLITLRNPNQLINDCVDFTNRMLKFGESLGIAHERERPVPRLEAKPILKTIEYFANKTPNGEWHIPITYNYGFLLIGGKTLEDAMPFLMNQWNLMNGSSN